MEERRKTGTDRGREGRREGLRNKSLYRQVSVQSLCLQTSDRAERVTAQAPAAQVDALS